MLSFMILHLQIRDIIMHFINAFIKGLKLCLKHIVNEGINKYIYGI